MSVSINDPLVTAWATINPEKDPTISNNWIDVNEGVSNNWVDVNEGVSNQWTEVDKAA
jgi:hypothetical protein